jgi:hypothetical protein
MVRQKEERPIFPRRAAVCSHMAPTRSKIARIPTPAETYRRAHAGKLLVVEPTTGVSPQPAKFFHLESVGSHPSGLFVTGRFAGGRIDSMRISTVREANEEEIASLRFGSEEESPDNVSASEDNAAPVRSVFLDNGR